MFIPLFINYLCELEDILVTKVACTACMQAS